MSTMITRITAVARQPEGTRTFNITLREDEGSVNIYADNDLIAWFGVENNKIVLHRSFPARNKDAFLLDEGGCLDVQD